MIEIFAEIASTADHYIIMIEHAAAFALLGVAAALAVGVSWLANLRQPQPRWERS